METENTQNNTFDTPEINAITGQNGVIPAEQVTAENKVTIPEVNLSETAPMAEQALAGAKAQTQEQTKLEELTAQRIADQQKQFAEQRATADLLGTQGQEFQSTFDAKMEEIKPIEEEVSRLNKQIAQETAALESQLINEEGRRIERGFISGRKAIIEQRGVARINALSGLLDAKNGDLENAQNKIAMSMTMLEKANKAEVDSKRASIELLREITGVSQADEEKELERLEKEQEKFEKERDDISNIALQAMQAGAGANEIQAITNAKSKDEAIAAAKSLGRMARIETAIKSAQLTEINNKLAEASRLNSGVVNEAEASNLGNNLKTVENILNPKEVGGKSILSRILGVIPGTQVLSNVIDATGIDKKEGLDSVIGQTATELKLKRGLFPKEENDYIANVENILQTLTLNTFAEAKEKGMTFGAMSQGEWDILSNSATDIAQKRVRKGNKETGQVIGYTGTPEAFKESFKVIEDSMKNQYLEATGEEYGANQLPLDEEGNIILPDETLTNEDYFAQ